MSRTYRRCIWDCRTEWERNENGHLIEKNDPPNYRVRVPDNFAFTHAERGGRRKVGRQFSKFDYDSATLSNNRIRSHIFGNEDIRMVE